MHDRRPRPAPSATSGRTRARNGPSSSGGAVRVDLAQLGRAQQAVLVELRLDEPERQPRRPDLAHAHLAQQVRQRADVILVRVGEDDRAHLAVVAGSRSRAGSGRRRDARRAGTRARRRRRSSRRRSRRRSCSCRPRRGRRAGSRVASGHSHRGSIRREPGVNAGPRVDSAAPRLRTICHERLRGDEQAEPREAVADLRELVVRRRDERQAVAADLVAEQVQRRLDRDRVRRERAAARRRGASSSSISRARSRSPSRAARTCSATCGPTTCVWTQIPPTPPSSRNGWRRLSSPA